MTSSADLPNPLPSGRYLSLAPGVHPDAGGQTRAILMRNRLFHQVGADAHVLTVSSRDDLNWRRDVLHERQLLLPGQRLLNIYEHYREHGWGSEKPRDVLPDLGEHLIGEEALPDGSPWRREYRLSENEVWWDYLRTDGSAFLRQRDFSLADPLTWETSIQRVDEAGHVTGEFLRPSGWYRRWVRDLAGGERTFVMLDSRFMVPHLAGMKAPHVHVLYLMHNLHLTGDHRWDRPMPLPYERLMEHVDDLDALVTLTERQGDDLAARRGRTSNMYVVPNPVDLPEPPAGVVERRPHQVTVLARLQGQKRLKHLVEAMQLVVERVPEARLDVYGQGDLEEPLRRFVTKLGLAEHVTLHGHDPRARDRLWEATCFVMTSRFEGYPLSTLESMSHGCPVVSYDIKYGPREQITSGVDGFLVEAGDIPGLAEHIVTLLHDADLAARMSIAARDKAAAHGPDRFVTDWARVVESVIRTRPERIEVTQAHLHVNRLRTGRGPRAAWPGRRRVRDRLRFDGRLHLTGRPVGVMTAEAEVTLHAVHVVSGERVEVPLRIRWRDGSCRIRASTRLADLFEEGRRPDDPAPEHVRLRLTVTWRNAAWSTHLTREASGRDGLETAYEADGTWLLTARGSQARADGSGPA